jgi:signal transduction histidine kinase
LPLEDSIEGTNRRTGETTSQGDAMIPAELLRQQRSLTQAERSAVATEFAASMSHDIRNPLAGIQMSLSNLIHESEDQALRGSLDTLLSETNRVTDLLTQAVAAARQRPEPFQDLDLVKLVESLFSLLRSETPAGIHLECEIEPGLQGHLPPNRLSHCLGNLLTNSIQAIGENKGRIQLEISACAEYLSFVITDNGPGFPQDTLSGGFRPFDSRNAGSIGLAMARRFVREMGGRIELSNGPAGSTESGARVAMLLPSTEDHG